MSKLYNQPCIGLCAFYVWALSDRLSILTFRPRTSTRTSIASLQLQRGVCAPNWNSLRPSVSQLQARTLQTRTDGVQCITRPATDGRAAYRVILANCWRTASLRDDAYFCSRYSFGTLLSSVYARYLYFTSVNSVSVYCCSLGLMAPLHLAPWPQLTSSFLRTPHLPSIRPASEASLFGMRTFLTRTFSRGHFAPATIA